MLIAAIPQDLCLAYANTLSWRGSDAPVERLTALGDLLGWLESSAGVAAAAVEEIKAWSREHPKKAATVFAEAIAIREALFRIFAAFAGGEAVRDREGAVGAGVVGDGHPARVGQVRGEVGVQAAHAGLEVALLVEHGHDDVEHGVARLHPDRGAAGARSGRRHRLTVRAGSRGPTGERGTRSRGALGRHGDDSRCHA